MADVRTERKALSPIATTSYRPVSLLAIIGFLLGLLSLSLFLFDAAWLVLFLPIPGLVVSALARRRIRRSEGTLVGANVAAAGIVLAVAGGLGYATMHLTTYLTIRSESKAFLDRWVAYTIEGKEVPAFLGTVIPRNRPLPDEDVDPRSMPARYGKEYDQFRANHVSSMGLRYGEQTTWEYKGVKDWFYLNESYYVKHGYRVQSPEASMDIVVMTRSEIRDTPKGKRRDWMIQMDSSQIIMETVRITPYGQTLRDCLRDAHKAIEAWVILIATGQDAKAFEAIQQPNDLKKLHFEEIVKAIRQGTAAGGGMVKTRAPMQLRDRQDGDKFHLELRPTVECGPTDVEFDLVVVTDAYQKGPAGWRISDLQLIGARKRINPMDVPTTPSAPRPPGAS